jgi:hypothetical protein
MHNLDTLSWFFFLRLSEQKKIKSAIRILMMAGVSFENAISILYEANRSVVKESYKMAR